jgi:hypothetical protein
MVELESRSGDDEKLLAFRLSIRLVVCFLEALVCTFAGR